MSFNFARLLAITLFATSSVLAAPTASNTAESSAVQSASSSSVAPSSAVVSTSATGTGVGTSSAPVSTSTQRPINSNEPGLPLWDINDLGAKPEPVRGSLGAPLQGPHNKFTELENPDLLAPPKTDKGFLFNAKWPFALSRNKLQTGGWARQQNVHVMPIATEMAAVNMRLEPGAIRELHWHKTAEWAYVLKGTTQITAVDTDGRNYVANVKAGDLWYFPAGIPHSLQATGDDAGGSEFVLVFPDGTFDEDDTFMLGDWLAHTPYEVVQKNFQAIDPKAFSHIPQDDLYIFPSQLPGEPTAPESPQGTVELPYSYAMSDIPATKLGGGSVKIVDSRTFKISTKIAAAEVSVEPGALRELHWHPTTDEWSFFIEGQGRISIFGGSGRANTFNYQAGDVAYIPKSLGHYVENTGNTTLKYLEIFNTDKFEDISLSQWIALTPPELVKAHLNLDDATIAALTQFREKAVVVPALRN